MPAEQHSAGGGAYINVTAQQSRYAVDAVDAPASKEILIKDLTLTVANRDLLSHATLHLVEAKHYVLVGRNGSGKSTLLRAMAEGLVPGIPSSTRILLLGQTLEVPAEQGVDDVRGVGRRLQGLGLGVSQKEEEEEETVLQHVLRSEALRQTHLHEAKVLSEALSHPTDALAPVRAYRRIHHERLLVQLKEAQRIAERRSGARGKVARKELIKLEERVEQSEARLQQVDVGVAVGVDADDIDAATVSAETQAAADMLAGVQTSLQVMDAAQAEAKARSVLLGLGFKDDSIDGPVSRLSGGWKSRCEIACALTQYADVLLLDEPTNFLDLPSILWLQGYIRGLRSRTTVLVTTHDRDFGDAVGEELIVLREKKIETFRGNLSLWERERWKRMRYLTKMKEAQEKQRRHMEKTVAGNLRAAREKGDDKKLKQAASRKKKLDERMGMEVGLRGGRFKLNRDLAGYHTSNRAEIEVPEFDPPVRLNFPRYPAELRFHGALVSLEKVSFAYPPAGRKSVPVLMDVDLTIHPRARVGLAGLNGSGKSTLVSLIMGQSAPTKGTVTRHPRATFGCFSQQSVEEITAIGARTPSLTALTHLMECAGSAMSEKDARALLASLGLHGQLASDVPLALLSGGQKVRVALAKLLRPPPPQLLVLDEVTTHLDADTILALVEALRAYEGAVVVVTHDRFFMRTVVEGESPYKLAPGLRAQMDEEGEDEDSGSEDEEGVQPGTVYRIVKGQLRKLEGGMAQYEEIAARAAKKLTVR
ncbi:P-loop containing nucleoside triphosphate hydrolase protein [Westerdykella ornata]|uniref:P-loop containing nucleoside triphosphate hydrolase protein n=1 Tax=Westerdykella ornata TaxID=318751 RepID=A0A6A6J4P6_WESOR|nr:P-loop containing nucleoside triphosphate hydrolase protein [Westerdykella ornata]KAF2271550.1 P-loop containing nucleoside triphosphate hydrolase protein [Westerdykella ornata]